MLGWSCLPRLLFHAELAENAKKKFFPLRSLRALREKYSDFFFAFFASFA